MKKFLGNLFTRRNGVQNESTDKHLPVEDVEERQFDHDFHESLIKLESLLHNEEDNEKITMAAIQSAYDFYDADWAGILSTDDGSEMWSATRWISRKTGANVETLFDDDEYFENYPLWVNSLKTGKPIVIEDVRKMTGITQTEIDRYAKLEVTGVIGVPFGMRPHGFMVIKNPRRFITNPDYLKMMAFVGLSAYYQQMLMDGMKMMQEGKNEEETMTDGSVRINLFGTPEVITAAGSLNERQYKSVQGWKILTYLTIHRKAVPARILATELWPDDDLDTRTKTVRNVIFRFRDKTAFLESEPLIKRDEMGYYLNPDLGITSDVDEFVNLWDKVSTTSDKDRQIEFLKKAMSLYKGRAYAEYSDEEWLMNDVFRYEALYIRITNRLLELLAEKMECHQVCDIATESLKKVSGNTQAYYWRIAALNKMGAVDTASSELDSVKSLISEEDYKILCDKLADENIKRGDCSK